MGSLQITKAIITFRPEPLIRHHRLSLLRKRREIRRKIDGKKKPLPVSIASSIPDRAQSRARLRHVPAPRLFPAVIPTIVAPPVCDAGVDSQSPEVSGIPNRHLAQLTVPSSHWRYSSSQAILTAPHPPPSTSLPSRALSRRDKEEDEK
ncbi:hypothetical protein M0R45_002279 [Rubus argutus]|uniref:Uncharacterized protein n=1 Tax=Rubus argutus TaxID=59490 RepID=A0AAW1VEL4_RUBAR